MAVPFRRTSKTTKRMRRTHFKLTVSGLVTCPNCGAMITSHRVCPQCGYYDGKKVVLVGDEKPVDEKVAKKAAKTEKKAKAKAAKEEKKEKKTTKKAKAEKAE